MPAEWFILFFRNREPDGHRMTPEGRKLAEVREEVVQIEAGNAAAAALIEIAASCQDDRRVMRFLGDSPRHQAADTFFKRLIKDQLEVFFIHHLFCFQAHRTGTVSAFFVDLIELSSITQDRVRIPAQQEWHERIHIRDVIHPSDTVKLRDDLEGKRSLIKDRALPKQCGCRRQRILIQ